MTNIDEILDQLNDCAKFTDTPLRRYRGFDRDECLRILTEFKRAVIAECGKDSERVQQALINLLDSSAVITPKEYDECFVHLEIPVKAYNAAYDVLPKQDKKDEE